MKKVFTTQLCFTLKHDVSEEELVIKLREAKEKVEAIVEAKKREHLEYDYEIEYISCHMPLEIVRQKGFDTVVDRVFSEVFGKDTIKYMVPGNTFEEFISNIENARKTAAERTDLLVIVDNSIVSGIAKEIELFSSNSILIIN